MKDEEIIALYFSRAEAAIDATASKYGGLCYTVARNILANREDSEECVNDTYLGLWNAIPPQRPRRLSVYISRITRNLALKKYEYGAAAKRNPEAVCSLDELKDCVSGRAGVESELENQQIEQAINAFLRRQSAEKRNIFLRRYWYFDSIGSICQRTGYSRSKVTSMLYQMRKKLKSDLEREGISL